ncbi:MAG: GNAT family N-acetyltransferase [Nanoarchaeota archaeon]|nr:GNAT family N-acetyltransferase [Nanoarchaeota archaeon]
MQKLLSRLQAKSKYTREKVFSYQEMIHSGQEIFFIDLLTSHDDLRLKQYCDFLSNTFEQGMDDDEKIMNEWIFDQNIAYHAVSDRKGKVIAAANSSYLPLGSSPTDHDAILAVWYVAVDKEYRGRRLANELYQNMYQFALDRAQVWNSKVKAIVGEASHQDIQTIEQVLRREEIARRRVYYEDAKGLAKEVSYVSPPLKWDSETGAPAEEAQPNHLMLKLTDGQESMPAKELLRIITAIYRDSYFPREEDFMNKESYARASAMVHDYLRTIEDTLAEARDGEVFLR